MRKLTLFLFGLFVCSSVMAQEVMVVGYPSGRPVSMTETISSLSGWEITGSITTETTLDVVIGGELTVEGTGDTEIAGDLLVDGAIYNLGVNERITFGSFGHYIDGNDSPTALKTNNLMITSGDTTLGQALNITDSAGTNRVTVLSNGNVGVGTTVPVAKLQVGSGTGANQFQVLSTGAIVLGPTAGEMSTSNFAVNGASFGFANYNTDAGAKATFYGSNSASGGIVLQSTLANGTADFVKVLVGNNGAKESMRVISSGNVGINTISPAYTLEVNGAIQGDNYYSADGTVGATVSTCTAFKNGLCVSGS